MKATFRTPALAAAVANLSGVAAKRSPKDVLRYIRLEATGGEAVAMASNAELTCRLTMDCEGELSPTLIEAAKLHSFMSLCRGESTAISLTKSGVVLACGSAKMTTNAPDVKEFPMLDEIKPTGRVACECHVLLTALRRGSIFTSSDSSRFALGGVHLHYRGGKLAVESTNSSALSLAASETVSADGELSAIVTRDAITALCNLLSGRMGTVELTTNGNLMHATGERFTLSCRLLEGRFPDVEAAISFATRRSATVTAGDLLAAVKQASLMLDSGESLGVDFDFADERLTVSSPALGAGQSVCEIACVNDGMSEFRANSQFVSTAIKTMDMDTTVRIESNAAKPSHTRDNPVRLVTNEGHLFIVMPMVKKEIENEQKREGEAVGA